MKVTVRVFAALREQLGTSSLEVEVGDGSTVADVVDRLADRHAGLRDHPFATALNQRYADASAAVGDGDEVALIPPVSGG
ncbi:MAG: MoaD/ThiS family protein [Planctomycetota bacterium JB042]